MSTEPDQAIVISKVKRTRKRIEIDWTQGTNKRGIKDRDNPKPEFTKSLDALNVIVQTVCGLSADYCTTNFRVIGFKLGKCSGVATVSVLAQKGVETSAKEFVFNTPPMLTVKPTAPGTYTPPLDDKQAELVAEAIEQAKAYIKGDRAQGQLALDEDEETEAEDESGEEADKPELPLAAPEMAHNKKRKKSKKAA